VKECVIMIDDILLTIFFYDGERAEILAVFELKLMVKCVDKIETQIIKNADCTRDGTFIMPRIHVETCRYAHTVLLSFSTVCEL